jgi:hypothetical protein
MACEYTKRGVEEQPSASSRNHQIIPSAVLACFGRFE